MSASTEGPPRPMKLLEGSWGEWGGAARQGWGKGKGADWRDRCWPTGQSLPGGAGAQGGPGWGQWLALAGPGGDAGAQLPCRAVLAHTLSVAQWALTSLEGTAGPHWGLSDEVNRGNPVRHWGLKKKKHLPRTPRSPGIQPCRVPSGWEQPPPSPGSPDPQCLLSVSRSFFLLLCGSNRFDFPNRLPSAVLSRLLSVLETFLNTHWQPEFSVLLWGPPRPIPSHLVPD